MEPLKSSIFFALNMMLLLQAFGQFDSVLSCNARSKHCDDRTIKIRTIPSQSIIFNPPANKCHPSSGHECQVHETCPIPPDYEGSRVRYYFAESTRADPSQASKSFGCNCEDNTCNLGSPVEIECQRKDGKTKYYLFNCWSNGMYRDYTNPTRFLSASEVSNCSNFNATWFNKHCYKPADANFNTAPGVAVGSHQSDSYRVSKVSGNCDYDGVCAIGTILTITCPYFIADGAIDVAGTQSVNVRCDAPSSWRQIDEGNGLIGGTMEVKDETEQLLCPVLFPKYWPHCVAPNAASTYGLWQKPVTEAFPDCKTNPRETLCRVGTTMELHCIGPVRYFESIAQCVTEESQDHTSRPREFFLVKTYKVGGGLNNNFTVDIDFADHPHDACGELFRRYDEDPSVLNSQRNDATTVQSNQISALLMGVATLEAIVVTMIRK